MRISKGFSSVFPTKNAWKSDDYEKITDKDIQKDGLTTFEASLAIISSIMGCTLVSVPYSLTVTGYLNGIFINLIVISLELFATHLYLQAMDVFKVRQLSELCYISMGRKSIYLVNGFFALIVYGVLVLFQIFFSSLCVNFFNKSGASILMTTSYVGMMQSRATYIILITILQIPLYLRKSLKELKI